MNIEHFSNLIAKRSQLQGKLSDKFIIKSLNDIDTKNQIAAINFIERLHNIGIPLININTNDYESCPQPKVYLIDKVYIRFSDYDYHNAFRYAMHTIKY